LSIGKRLTIYKIGIQATDKLTTEGIPEETAIYAISALLFGVLIAAASALAETS
jgi:hypothetical protein